MNDFEKFAKELTKAQVLKELLSQREILPCHYGGGNCISSYWFLEGSEDDVARVGICLKARQVKDAWYVSTDRRTNELIKMDCPEPRRGLLTGWKCKFADGKIYLL